MRMLRTAGHSVIDVVDAPEPVAGPGEVLVKTAVSAICGSEMHAYRGAGVASGNGGHEAAGTIVALGPGSHLAEGQRVGICCVIGCGRCDYCAQGQQTYCAERHVQTGMHAERIAVPARACQPLPDDVPWDAGVLLSGDGMGVPYHTSRKLTAAEVQTVAVFGVGPIGLGNTLMQSYSGRRVIAVDVSRPRLDLALRLGAADAIDAGTVDAVEAIRQLTGGRGADVCIEAAGRLETLRQCFAALRPGGTLLINGEQGALALSPSDDFIRRDITAVGSWFYHYAEFPAMLSLYRQGLRVPDLVTHRFPLEDAAEAYREFAAGRTGKVLLMMTP